MQDLTKGVAVRKVVVSEFVSLDGMMDDPSWFGTIESCFAGLLPELALYGRQDPHDNGPDRIPERRASRQTSGRLDERIRAP
jgi:hypothetical protein